MKENKLYNTAFGFLLLLAVLLVIPWRQDFLLGDDYLGAANQLLHGNWDIENNFWANRIGSYLPYAAGMWLFGFGTWLTFITTLEFLLVLVMVYSIIKKTDQQTGFIAACLLAVSTEMHLNAAVIMGDVAITFIANAVVLAYFYYSFYIAKNERNAKKWGIYIALLVFAAFWVKESIVFYLPVLAWLFCRDRKQTAAKLFLQYFLFASISAGFVVMFIYWRKTGHPLYRIYAVEGGPSASDCNYATANWQTLLNRITWLPFQFLVEKYSFGSLLLLSVLQLLFPETEEQPAKKFFKIYLIGTLGMWWAGSQGITSYNPVALLHRLWLPLLVPMAINSAFFIHRIMSGKLSAKTAKAISITTLIFLFLSMVSLYFAHRSYLLLQIEMPNLASVAAWYFILCTSLLLALHTNVILEIIPTVRSLMFCIVVLPFISGGFMQLQWYTDRKLKGIKSDFDSEKEMVNYVVSQNPHSIITDKRVALFYYAYIMDMEKKLPFVDYNTIPFDSIKKGDYLLLNPERQEWFIKNINVTLTYTKAHYDIAEFVNHPEQHGFVLIKENATDRLYRFDGK